MTPTPPPNHRLRTQIENETVPITEGTLFNNPSIPVGWLPVASVNRLADPRDLAVGFYAVPISPVAVPLSAEETKIECRSCGKSFDPADLNAVIFHETHTPHVAINFEGVHNFGSFNTPQEGGEPCAPMNAAVAVNEQHKCLPTETAIDAGASDAPTDVQSVSQGPVSGPVQCPIWGKDVPIEKWNTRITPPSAPTQETGSDTPRTDADWQRAEGFKDSTRALVMRNCARTLERELKEAREERDRLQHYRNESTKIELDLRADLDRVAKEVQAVLEHIPKESAVRVCEGGGPENLFASLAVSVVKMTSQLAAANSALAESERKREEQGEQLSALQAKVEAAPHERECTVIVTCPHELNAAGRKEARCTCWKSALSPNPTPEKP